MYKLLTVNDLKTIFDGCYNLENVDFSKVNLKDFEINNGKLDTNLKIVNNKLFGSTDLSEIKADKGSFISLTFVKGNGKINNISFAKGDTFFIPNNKTATISGDGEFILTTIK